MGASPSEIVNQAIGALRRLDRRSAASLLRSLIAQDAGLGESWKSVATLADRIGEIDISVEAMRRYAQSAPRTLEKQFLLLGELANRGRIEEVERLIEALPRFAFERTEITHLRATLLIQRGEFNAAERLIRRTINDAPLTGQHWLGLSVIKTFAGDDPDLQTMQALAPKYVQSTALSRSAFCYALGKALHDAERFDDAFEAYEHGAALQRAELRYDAVSFERSANHTIGAFDRAKFNALKRSQCNSGRVILVTGLPRSGTTLVEQVLTSHSAVSDGAEMNLLRAAMHPVGQFTRHDVDNFNQEPPSSYEIVDPWGSIAEDYLALLDQRFGTGKRIIDKTLDHSAFMGFILHALPASKVIWLRRDPEDNAISAFRNYFSSPVPWSWSLSDIGRHFRVEDALHAHWTRVFPERILTVQYESLTRDPECWIGRILAHVDLPTEADVFQPHKQKRRAVTTASVAQVRNPISAGQIGASSKYSSHLAAFRSAYSNS